MTTAQAAVLYGVGVGPGASDLLTLRAQHVLRTCAVLILPRSNDHTPSMAWTIAKPAVGDVPGQERVFVTLPMSKDPARLRPAWEKAFAAIDARLACGQSVAFLTEGDPSLFSSFIYLAREAPRRWPAVRVVVVPGVSSLACGARSHRRPARRRPGTHRHPPRQLWHQRSRRTGAARLRHRRADEWDRLELPNVVAALKKH